MYKQYFSKKFFSPIYNPINVIIKVIVNYIYIQQKEIKSNLI